MARYTGPKNKLARKIGEDLGLKTNAMKVAKRVGIRPGQHGSKGRRKLSDYGVQLKEKQKLKFIYGVMEKQVHRLYVEASRNPTATGAALIGLLERRLDNVVFRLGLAPTRASARQIVAHGQVTVNGKKMSIPSYRVNVKDVIVLKPKAIAIPAIGILVSEESQLPAWLERKGPAGTVARLPERADVKENIDEQLIVEYFSR